MPKDGYRRTILTATTALGAAAIPPRGAPAQAARRYRPGRFVARARRILVRGAHVLSMDDKIGDFPSGDVHVRDGAIVAVAASVSAPGAQVIAGKA